MKSDESLTPWQQAGGFPQDEWRAVLMWAIGKHIAATMAERAYAPSTISRWTKQASDRLKEEDEKWDAIFRGVLRGDPRIFGDAHTAWMRDTGQLD